MNVNKVQNERVNKQSVSECETKYIKENFYTYSDWHGIA